MVRTPITARSWRRVSKAELEKSLKEAESARKAAVCDGVEWQERLNQLKSVYERQVKEVLELRDTAKSRVVEIDERVERIQWHLYQIELEAEKESMRKAPKVTVTRRQVEKRVLELLGSADEDEQNRGRQLIKELNSGRKDFERVLDESEQAPKTGAPI